MQGILQLNGLLYYRNHSNAQLAPPAQRARMRAAERLSDPGRRLDQRRNDLATEGLQVSRLARRDQIAVPHDFGVEVFGAGIPQVIFDRAVAGRALTL
jgi:hypothetical protein